MRGTMDYLSKNHIQFYDYDIQYQSTGYLQIDINTHQIKVIFVLKGIL